MVAGNSSYRLKSNLPSSQPLVDILNLLGFTRSEKKVSEGNSDMDKEMTPSLFHHPNIQMFQKVMHFLLTSLDEKRVQEDFRYCWPILKMDKKAESQFRKTAFAWYKQLQLDNADKIPQVAMATWMSPGDRKFLEFINPFVRFVAAEKFKRDPLFLNVHSVAKVRTNRTKILRALRTSNTLTARTAFQGIQDIHNTSKARIDEMADSCRKLREERRGLLDEEHSLEDSIRAEMSLADSDSVSLSLQTGCERLTESFADTLQQIEAFNKTASAQTNEILDILSQRENGANPQLDMTGLVSASQMSNDCQLEEVIQKLFDSVLAERDVFSKKESDLFPCGKAEKMAEFSDIYREKFAQEYHELNQVVPQMQSAVENLQDDVFTAGNIAEVKSNFLFRLWESSRVPSVETVHPDHTQYDFVLSDTPGLSEDDAASKRAFYGIQMNAPHQVADEVTCHDASVADASTISVFDPILSSSRVDATLCPTTAEKLENRLSQIVEEESGLWGTPLTPNISVRDKLPSPLSTPKTPGYLNVNRILTSPTATPVPPNLSELAAFRTPLVLRNKGLLDSEVGITDCSPMTLVNSPTSARDGGACGSFKSKTPKHFSLSPSFYNDEDTAVPLAPPNELFNLECDEELLFCETGSKQPERIKKMTSRPSAIIRKRLSDLTKTISVAAKGTHEVDLGDKENFSSLLMNEPDATEEMLDLSLSAD